jgi:SAM-dependent methyltransferase
LNPDFNKIISELTIDNGVYRPNQSSIELAKAALKCKKRFLEIGTGSGFVSLVLYLNGYDGISTDISPKAVACAKNNFMKFNIDSEPVLSDLYDNLKGKFDFIIFNPPTNENENDRERLIKNSFKRIIPLFLLKKITILYHSINSKKRREYLLGFIAKSKEYLNPGGVIILNLINLDAGFFNKKLEAYNVKISKVNNESTIFRIEI